MGPKFIHSYQVPREYWCCFPRNCTLRTTGLGKSNGSFLTQASVKSYVRAWLVFWGMVEGLGTPARWMVAFRTHTASSGGLGSASLFCPSNASLWQRLSFSHWLEDSRNMSSDSMTKKIRSRENLFLSFLLRSGFQVFISFPGTLLFPWLLTI